MDALHMVFDFGWNFVPEVTKGTARLFSFQIFSDKLEEIFWVLNIAWKIKFLGFFNLLNSCYDNDQQ